jgi:hypothetical protein
MTEIRDGAGGRARNPRNNGVQQIVDACCCITGGSIASGLTYTQNWYQQALTTYKTLYGVEMPIDIWNIHSYCGATQIENPDKIINEFVSPFVTWCHTVQGGTYASCPVWITELPIGEWMGATSPENAACDHPWRVL